MKKCVYLLILVAICFANNYYAQNYKLNGELRFRVNANNKNFSNSIGSNNFTELRSRVGINLSPTSSFAAFIQLQDNRILGTEKSTNEGTNEVDLKEANGFVKNLFGLPVDWQFGRMTASSANSRFIGKSDWGSGRTFDGMTFLIKSQPLNFNIYAFQLAENSKADDLGDSYFGGISMDLKSIQNFEISLFAFDELLSKYSGNNSITTGFYSKGKFGNFIPELEAAYQFGNKKIANRDFNVDAYFFAINASYKFDFALYPTLNAGIELLSGDKDASDKKYNAFNTLYGTKHGFFGYMDYFVNIPNDTKNLGLIDYHFKIISKPFEEINFYLAMHKFNSQVEYTTITSKKTNDFGIETDFVANYIFQQNLTFSFGLSFFAPGEIFKEWKGKDNAFYGYFITTMSL